jgi:serine/threonine protein kinase
MMKEARIAEYLDHPSVTHYFGLFVEEADLGNDLADLYLVSDYVNSGLAKHYLKEHRTSQVAEKLVSVGPYLPSVELIDLGSFATLWMD